MLKIYTDGAARGNPGPAGIGVVVQQAGKTIKEISEYIGKTTNNIAEYKAFIIGLKAAVKLKAKSVHFLADSELLVKQIKGEYRVKNAGLKPLFQEAKQLTNKIGNFSISHIRRENNSRADQLANQAIDITACR
ncbi:ribonuclease HI family protein [Candidatus Margulisiibacteriota bacterium]